MYVTEPVTPGAGRTYLDALAEVLAVMRPDWKRENIRAAIGRTKAAPIDVILNSISGAADTLTHSPARIEFYDRRRPTPIPPPYRHDTRRAAPPPRCDAHDVVLHHCPECREATT